MVKHSKDLQTNYDQDRSNKKPDETIGEVFLKFAPFLKTYTAYTNNFYNISEMLRVMRLKSKEFNDFLNEQSRISGQTLESFLIMPVQRIPVCVVCLLFYLCSLQLESCVRRNELVSPP